MKLNMHDNYFAPISAEVPVDSKGKLIERKDVEESVYAQGIREFNWPEHMDGPKFHTMVSFF